MRFIVDRFDKRIKGAYPEVDFPINGNFVVKVPPAITIDITPDMTLDELQTNKAAGILAYYPTMSSIIYEDFLDSSGVDITADPDIFMAGIGSTIAYPTGFSPHSVFLLPEDTVNSKYGRLTSAQVDIGSVPTSPDVIVSWECFQLTNTESDLDGVSRVFFNELDPDSITCEVTFDGGSNWEQVYDATFHQMNDLDQLVKIRFINNLGYSDQKVWLGSYSILHV